MENSIRDEALVLFAVKLVQPGMLRDIVEGLERLAPSALPVSQLKISIRAHLEEFRSQGVVTLYSGQRYMLTARGEAAIEESGIRPQIEARRMFLLKETRRVMKSERSDARVRLLQQRS